MTRSRLEAADRLRIAALRFARRLRQEKADGQLTDGQLSILFTLDNHGPLTLTAIAERERISAQSANRTVEYLIDEGYIDKRVDPAERRKQPLSISAAGGEVVQATREQRAHWLESQLDTLTDSQRRTLAEAGELLMELAAR